MGLIHCFSILSIRGYRRRIRTSRRSSLKYAMPSRYMHLFNVVQAIPLGRKSVTRNGWANFLFRSAAGLAPLLLYSYTIHPHAYLSNIEVRVFIEKCTAGNSACRCTRTKNRKRTMEWRRT